MKVNLLIDSNKTLGGYVNIDPYASDGDTSKIKGIVHDLEAYVDDGEAEEIRAIDVLQYFAHTDSAPVVENWLKKLRHGGKIIIGTVDIVEVCRALSSHRIDIDQANILIYGNQKRPWTFYKSTFTASQLVEYLESKNLKITKKRIQDFNCVVEAVRA